MKSITVSLCAVIILLAAGPADAQKVELLWPAGAPGAVGSTAADRPSLTIFLPEASKSVGTGVVVCPGGGYGVVVMDKEGYQPAKWLNSLGIAAFVLRYRVAPRYHYPAEIEDGERAVRFVRFHAQDYGISPDRIGIWGFSAGGHLASSVGTHFDGGKPGAADPIDRVGDRPDFMILSYAVISFTTPYTHLGSMHNLLGPHPNPKLVRSFSNELQVTSKTPPTFLFSTDSDTTVPAENSVLFYLALRKHHVPAELHIFRLGPHGVGLAQDYSSLSIWPTLLATWLRVQGMLR
ncbi:MAG: alpha/beta hydrolase [Acidobacteria bacterium]|nr:alpha/beta hydrolase [Acidobacteriota bacterium]